ncbi:MAG TPA: response regulator [Deltaproteobacteria bacterium]|nr:response regulator [Deltaproteobacteria bacterium]
MSDIIKVLIVDDASLMQKILGKILSEDPEINVVGYAKNGLECLEKIEEYNPDVISLDIDMPLMDGLTTVKHIMIEKPTPTVVVSSMTQTGYVTFEALRLGVIDFIPKPSGSVSLDMEAQKNILKNRIKLSAGIQIKKVKRVWFKNNGTKSKHFLGNSQPDKIVGIGTSLGGPNTIIRIVSSLYSDFDGAILAMQEIDPQILPAFCSYFDEIAPIKVVPSEDSIPLRSGVCYLVSNKCEVEIEENEREGKVLRIRKSLKDPISCMFNSIASHFRENSMGILLTGIGSDGIDGLRAIINAGGMTIAQEEECCVFPNLTQSAIEHGVVQQILPDREIPDVLTKWKNHRT